MRGYLGRQGSGETSFTRYQDSVPLSRTRGCTWSLFTHITEMRHGEGPSSKSNIARSITQPRKLGMPLSRAAIVLKVRRWGSQEGGKLRSANQVVGGGGFDREDRWVRSSALGQGIWHKRHARRASPQGVSTGPKSRPRQMGQRWRESTGVTERIGGYYGFGRLGCVEPGRGG